jgi:hypothetical protein
MRKPAFRILLVAVVHLLLFEALMELSVRWRESAGELWLLALAGGTLAACVWAFLPSFPQFRLLLAKVCARGFGAIALFAALHAGDYYYSWHLRPNLGLYQEPGWVAQHPGFQHELRARIQANMWKGGPSQ